MSAAIEPGRFAWAPDDVEWKGAQKFEAHDVSDEERDDKGRWTDGGGVDPYGHDHPITRDDDNLWGATHQNSFTITGASAEAMGLPGWTYPKPDDEWAKVHAAPFMKAIADDKLGAETDLYHSFANVRGTDFRPGDTLSLPLTATAGEIHDYARTIDPKNQVGEPTVLKFPTGTPIAGYSRRLSGDIRENEAENARIGFHSYTTSPWSEAIVAGKFEVTGVTTEPEWRVRRHDGSGINEGPLVKVVSLKPLETFDPRTKTWHPTKTRLWHG